MEIDIDSIKYNIDLNNPVARYINPILTAFDVNKVLTDLALKVKTVHNAGVVLLVMCSRPGRSR
jgi:hypothetical protein